MAGPAVVVVAGFITAGLAIKTWDGLVSDDYYKQGLGVNQVKSRDLNAQESGVTAEIVRNESMVQVFVRANDGTKLPDQLMLRLVHPTRNGMDQMVQIKRQGAGFYRGSFRDVPDGRFNVSLEDSEGGWRLTGEWANSVSGEPLVLSSASVKPATVKQ